MRRLVRHPALWLCALLGWAGVLWFLSSLETNGAPLPIPQFDKFEHFSYFLCGGLLAAGFRYLLRPEAVSWRKIILTAIITTALVGFIDEWHQCYTPGRSGADPWDWLADVAGGAAGAWLFKMIHHRLPGFSCGRR